MITKRLPVSWMTGPAIYAVLSLKRCNMPPEKRRSLIGSSELLLIEASVSSSVTLPPPHSGATWPSPSPRRKGYFWMSDTTQSHTKSIRSSGSRQRQAVGGGGWNAVDKGISRSHKKKKNTSTEITFPVISGKTFTVIIQWIASTIRLVCREGEEAGLFPAVFTPSGNSYKTARPVLFFLFFYGSRVDL